MSQVKGVKPFVVSVSVHDLEALRDVVAVAAEAEAQWLAEAREDAGLVLLRGAALSEARRRIRVERDRLRALGRLYGTQELVMARAVREELTARSLMRDWPDPPAGELSAPGRRWGVSPDPWDLPAPGSDGIEDADERETPPRLAVRLPVELGETLVRAAYWTSAPAVDALREWDTRWGDGPTAILREAMRRNGGVSDLDVLVAMLAPRPEAAALDERARLRAQILTSGDLMRAALDRAIR
ncbi:hypothetical protein ABZV29_38235 [Streptomyces sp. NPDC005236]|uniref:hypothetical protein n=1 Tax=Streptomyces sp. NPDC005236 TaxID=3157028 RepID=UPI00339DCB55